MRREEGKEGREEGWNRENKGVEGEKGSKERKR